MLAQTMRRRILFIGGSGVLSTTGPVGFGAAAAGACAADFATGVDGGGGTGAELFLSGVATSPDWLSTSCSSSVIEIRVCHPIILNRDVGTLLRR